MIPVFLATQELFLYSSRPWVAGISGGAEGAYSIALSGGYDDDVDLGYALCVLVLGSRRNIN